MKIVEFMDVKILQNIQDQFSDATGLAAIAVDAEGNYITKGSNFTDFCMKYTRGCEEGLRRCVKNDTECRGTYYCHAGLMDFAADIMVNGEKVGGIIGGQVLPAPPDFDKFAEIARELGVDEKQYIAAVKKVPIRSERMIRAAADLLKDVVNKVVELEYYRTNDSMKLGTLTAEIGNSLQTARVINAKTKSLEGIASKQNVLSLNASIEAARAGVAGLGFAVVANQMGDLSKKSTLLYKEIKEGTDSIASSIEKMNKSIDQQRT